MSEQNVVGTLQVIIPNLHWHYTGVTTTSRFVAPLVARHLRAAWFGTDAPEAITPLRMRDLMSLWMRKDPIVWHARRNNEMIAGLILKTLGWPFRIIFTSAAQRHHTWITRYLIARMDSVIATSEAAASFLSCKVTVIPHGVDAERFRPAADRAIAVAETALPGRYIIGCFGRVRPQKGTDLFVDAMCALLPRYPNFSAVVVGAIAPDQRQFADRLRKKITTEGLQSRIVIMGERPPEELPRWFQRLTIYAFTSRNEGFGLTLIEAMASGAALVATRAGASELVVRDGETGILISPNDVTALVSALEPLMSDPEAAAAMGLRSRNSVIAEFSLDTEAQRISDIYRAVLVR